MRKQSVSAVAGAAVFLALLAVPPRAQNFQDGSTDTIWSGNFRLTGSPVHLFGPDGRPDRTGGAFRLGYGITDSFDLEAKTGFFDGFDLVGGDGHYRLLNGATSLSVRAGGHEAVKWGFAERLDLMVEGGVGLNDNSPSYVTAGLALYMPVSRGAQGRRH
jgi:hypothetical protein